MGKNGKGKLAKGTKKAATTKDSSNKDAGLWDEIQKLGGDKADLDMLADVDTPAGSKHSKSAKKTKKGDASAIQGDLSAFAKSLGLSTDVPEFSGLTDKERKAMQGKSEKKEKKAKKDAAKKEKPQAASQDDIEKTKATKKEKPKKEARKEKKEAAAAAAATTDSDDLGIPGFKVKSAKDSAPLSTVRRLTIDPNPQWFSIALDDLEIAEDAEKPSEEVVLQKFQYAEELLDRENSLYTTQGAGKKSMSTADKSFVSNILSSGTLTDRVSALTLIVQESPVHGLGSLNQLMQMVKKNNRREALLAVASVKDLMVINLLPSNRKLRYFADQPISARGVTSAHWIMWAFEDKLKRHYFELIQTMEAMSYDPVVHTRQNMVTFFEDLLEQKPEQEKNLLRLLVNKLGDNERQLAARASYLILKLLNAHPNMKFIVVKTIQELLLTKSSTKERAQYYTMITLNQIILSSKDVNTANLLLEVYFIFFKKLLKITQDNDAADAAEAEAAGPDSDNDDDEKKKAGATAPPKKEKKGREQKVYIGQKALRKAKEELAKKHAEEEKSMDNKLLAAILTGVNRALPFAKMDDAVMDQHVGVIFQIAHAGNFNTVVQSLVLLNHIARLRPTIADRFYRTLYDSLLDPRLDGTSKKAMYLNVLFKAMKADSDTKRVMAFIKRIMQACQQNQVEFASGALFLVSQVLALNPQLNTMLTQPEDHEDAEHTYDPLKRDPRFANAQTSCLWEAAMLAHHYHPSITHSIKQVFAGEQVAAISNLHNHSLAHFLDRFVFRRPKAEDSKKSSTMRGQSLMQPFVASSESAEFELGEHGARIMRGHLLSSKRVGGVIGGLDLTSKKIADLQKSDMPADEQFFLQFFQTKKERMGKRVKKSKQEGESGLADDSTGFANAMGEDADELDEDEVWKAMTSGMPRTGEGDEDGEDVDEDDDDLLAALQEDEDEGDDDDDMGESDSSDEGEDSADLDEDQSDDDGFPTFDDEMSEASDDGEVSDEPASKGTKRKGDDSESADKKKKKKKEKLPMFGSFEDYAHLIDNDEGLE